MPRFAHQRSTLRNCDDLAEGCDTVLQGHLTASRLCRCPMLSGNSGQCDHQAGFMRVLVVQNYQDTGLGLVGRALEEAEAGIDLRQAYLGEDLAS